MENVTVPALTAERENSHSVHLTEPTGTAESVAEGFEEPKCDKCGVRISSGSLPLICPHARACALVMDDDQWESVESFRESFNITRATVSQWEGEK